MLKRTLIALLIALPLSVFAQKFGYVDAESVLTAMPEFAAAQQQIEEASKKYQEEYNKLTDEMNKKYTEFQNIQKDPSTPQTILESRLSELQGLEQKINQFSNTATQDIQRQQQQLMAPVEQKLLDAIKAVGDEGNFTFILPGTLALYNGASAVNVTPLVKSKLGIQ